MDVSVFTCEYSAKKRFCSTRFRVMLCVISGLEVNLKSLVVREGLQNKLPSRKNHVVELDDDQGR